MKTTQKRGLSDIITTVLIILLAIAAVVMIWGFIKKPIEQGGQQIQASSDCFALKLVPKACTLVNASGVKATGNNATAANVTVQWAEGSVKLGGVKVVVTDSKGLNNVTQIPAPASILETTSGNIIISSIDRTGTLTLGAVGVIVGTDGKEVSCTSSTQETIVCS